jgi:peptidoglycan/LPS O-acetylase OafA/YrhL
MSSLTMHTLTYRPDIDGLRAIAVVPVVLYHAGFGFFSGGFVGVDVFFVISGYLITSIIAQEIAGGDFSIKQFYARRARRLFPALFAVLAACCIVAPMLLMPWELEDFGQSVATTAIFASNFLFFTEAGYFDGPAELKPLLHTWSLAIEEQYYLLFPGFLILIHRYMRGSYLPWILGLFITSLLLSIWSVAYASNAAFYLLPSRTWELLLGSLLVLTGFSPRHQALRELCGWTGLALIVIAVLTFTSDTPFPGAAALLPCVGTALIIVGGRGGPATLIMRLLSARSVVYVGLISYSLYLWHWPILVFAKHYLVRELTLIESTCLVALSFMIAALSLRFIEKPFRGKGGLLNTRGLFRTSAALIGVTIFIGLVFDESEGLPSRLPANVERIAQVSQDKPAARKRCEGIKPDKVTYDFVCRVNDLEVTPSFIVWGDSHAMAMIPTLGEVAKNNDLNGLNLSSNGCVPFLNVSRPGRDLTGECSKFNDKVLSMLEAHPEIAKIVLIAHWSAYAEGTTYGSASEQTLYLATADHMARSLAENQDNYESALTRTLQAIASLGREIVIIGPIPEIGRDVPNVLAKAQWRGQPLDLRITTRDYRVRQRFVFESFARAGDEVDLRFYSPQDRFCPNGFCDVVGETGLPLYFDDSHVSSHGAKRLIPIFESIFSTEKFGAN